MVRVARPGARIVIVEPDYGTLVVDGADPVVSGAILNHRREHFRSGRIGRQLPRLCKELGLTQVSVTLLTVASTDMVQGDDRHVLRKYVADAQAAGVVSEEEGATWLADLEAAGATGRYRHAVSVFLVSGRVP
jgi:hypothetical protein